MNSLPNKNTKISRYLNESADEYKELLYKALINQSEGLDDLNINELIKLDNEAKKPLYQIYQRQNQKKKVFDYIRLSAQLVIAVVAVLIAAYLPKNDSSSMSMILIAILSTLIAIISIGTEYYREKMSIKNIKLHEKSEDYKPLLTHIILEKWRELEGLSNDISVKEIKNTSSVIDTLYVNKYINLSEHDTLKDFLRMRNETAHAKISHYSVEQINDMIEKVEKILKKIHNAI